MVLLLLHQLNAQKESKVFPNHSSKRNYNRRKLLNSGLYALTGRTNPSGTGLLLCCVCHEQNTTYRYEVVYKDNEKTLSFNNTTLYQNESSLLKITDDSGIESTDDHEYYNFPPRHPRHGHLKWRPVYTSILPLSPNKLEGLKTNCSVKTYPDYPVHIPTTTLRRAASVL
jgi:hypothetical protein